MAATSIRPDRTTVVAVRVLVGVGPGVTPPDDVARPLDERLTEVTGRDTTVRVGFVNERVSE